MGHLKKIFTAKPKPVSVNRKFNEVLSSLWTAGTMGAYFTFLFTNLAFDIPAISRHQIDGPCTFDVWVRYVYLLWFLVYFFASNVNHERDKELISKWNIAFDVIQAMVSFGAAYFLGFLTRSDDTPLLPYKASCAVEAANGAIAVICISSLVCFGFRENEDEKGKKEENRKLNGLRLWGLGSSLLALGAVVLASHIGDACGVFVVYAVAVLCGTVPFLALGCFIGIEWKRVSPESPPAGAGCTGGK
jgi:hypothetical protein